MCGCRAAVATMGGGNVQRFGQGWQPAGQDGVCVLCQLWLPDLAWSVTL